MLKRRSVLAAPIVAAGATIAGSPISARQNQNDELEARIAALEQSIATLEARVSALEGLPNDSSAPSRNDNPEVFAADAVYTAEGSGTQTVGPIPLESGRYRVDVRIETHGMDTIAVILVDDGSYSDYLFIGELIEGAGVYDYSTTTRISSRNDYYAEVETMGMFGTAEWEIGFTKL